VSVASTGSDGTTSAEYVISVTVPVTTGLLNLESNGQIGLLFSSADCGNDVIQGVLGPTSVAIQDTPEPGPATLVLTGLALLTAGRQWRKRQA
jgi:hypothetical protein